jgi:hypothetical protein
MVVAALALAPAGVSAGVATPHLLPLQGYVTDPGDNAISAGDVRVRIYDAATGGSLVYDSGSDFTGAISGGRFDVVLGSITPLSLDNTLLYHMEIAMDGDEIIGDAGAGRYAFYPGGGSHSRSDLEARLDALETATGSGGGTFPRVPAAPAFTDSSASYRITYGLIGVGRVRGASSGFDLEGNLLLQPVGMFASYDHLLRLGPWYLGETEDSLAVVSYPDSLSPGDAGTIVVEVLDVLGRRVDGVAGKIGFASLAGRSALTGAITEDPDTLYALPFTTSSTGPDTLVISVAPATTALRDTLVIQSTWFPAEVRLLPSEPGVIQAGDSIVLTAEILDALGRRVPDELVPLGVGIVSGGGSVGSPVPQADTTFSVLFTAGSVPDTVLIEAYDPEASSQPRDTVTVVVTDRATIVSVLDVGNDQGRQVRVIWNRDLHDQSGASPVITEYVVWRRVDELPALGPVRMVTLGAFEPTTITGGGAPGVVVLAQAGALWEPVGPQIPAMMWDQYASVVPTLADSTITYGMHWSVFFVSAHTADPQVYFASEPDSGYSLDNLAPAAPTGLSMTQAAALSWDEAPEADFDYFTVYGGMSDVLDESAEALGHTVTPGFDANGTGYLYYFVTATDFSGNEGEASAVETAVGVPGEGPLPVRTVLHQARPNPFRGSVVIAYDLLAAEAVRLTIYDLRGRTVATLVDGPVPAGRHSASWSGRDADGRALPQGLYFYRLEAGAFVEARRLVLLR